MGGWAAELALGGHGPLYLDSVGARSAYSSSTWDVVLVMPALSRRFHNERSAVPAPGKPGAASALVTEWH